MEFRSVLPKPHKRSH